MGYFPQSLVFLSFGSGWSVYPFLYALFFSSSATLHSSSNHPLPSGLGWYPIVCSAASVIASFNCFHSSCILISSFSTCSVSGFPNYFPSCCWNLVTSLGSRSASMCSFFVFLFSSCLLYAILHLYFPLTKKWSESLLAPLHDFTSSTLLAFLLSINI